MTTQPQRPMDPAYVPLPETRAITHRIGPTSGADLYENDALIVARVTRLDVIDAVADDVAMLISNGKASSASLIMPAALKKLVTPDQIDKFAKLTISVRQTPHPDMKVAAETMLNEMWPRWRFAHNHLFHL